MDPIFNILGFSNLGDLLKVFVKDLASLDLLCPLYPPSLPAVIEFQRYTNKNKAFDLSFDVKN